MSLLFIPVVVSDSDVGNFFFDSMEPAKMELWSESTRVGNRYRSKEWLMQLTFAQVVACYKTRSFFFLWRHPNIFEE